MASFLERERAERLEYLGAAEQGLRAILHGHLVDPLLRAHAERALARVCEATVVITSHGEARSVDTLGRQLDRVGRLLSTLPTPTASRQV